MEIAEKKDDGDKDSLPETHSQRTLLERTSSAEWKVVSVS